MAWKGLVILGTVLCLATTGYADPPRDDCGDIGICASFPEHPKVWVNDFWPDCRTPDQCGGHPWCRQLRTCLDTEDERPCCCEHEDGESQDNDCSYDWDTCRDCSPEQCEVDCEGVGRCPPVCPTCRNGEECPPVCPTCPDLEAIGDICEARCTAVADACAVNVREQLDQDNDGMLDLWTQAWVMDFAPSAMKQLFGKKFTKCRERGGGILLSNQILFGKPVLSVRCVKSE